jgi:formylglycine-generating enzyme required for sulfatase activity
MKLVYVPSGEFTMGSPRGEKGREDDEEQHGVKISRPFYLGKHEVSRGQFRRFVEATGYQTEAEKDGKGGGGYVAERKAFVLSAKQFSWRETGFPQTDAHPVVNVSWNDARAFCEWLSKQEGKEYRLPTEAEWEFCCRAGTRTRFHGGNDDESLQRVGNVADLSLKSKWHYGDLPNKTYRELISKWFDVVTWDDGYPFTSPVGQYDGNAFGIHDMHGNVWEWCQDWYQKDYTKDRLTDPQGPGSGEHRVFRGGSFSGVADSCRSAFRNINLGDGRLDYRVGFRVLRVP